MELRHLRYFVVVAEERHFGRAAERLHISQPPLSQQIQRLEKELGLRLFDRDRRQVSLTGAGEQLLGYARQVLVHAERTEGVALQIRQGSHGVVRLGFVGSALYGVLPSQVRRLREQEPGISLTVREMETGQQVEALLDGTIDLGIVRPPLDHPDVTLVDIETEPLVIVVPEAHRFAHRPSLHLQEMAEDEFVLFSRQLGTGYWDTAVQACGAAGFVPRVAYEAEHIHTMVGLVAAGLGISLVPASVVRLQLPGVRYVSLLPPVPELRLALAWVGDLEDLSPSVRRANAVLSARRHEHRPANVP
jgi:DNA-binding transcriptional LysR family regulator